MAGMIYGVEIDREGRCIHYHGPTDIIANKCAKCLKFYACYKCHDELEDHTFEPVDPEEENTVMCGSCGRLYSYMEYASIDKCTECLHDFNPGCSLHKTIYSKQIKAKCTNC